MIDRYNGKSPLNLSKLFHVMQNGDFLTGPLSYPVEIVNLMHLEQSGRGEFVQPRIGLRKRGEGGRVVEGNLDVLGLAAERLHLHVGIGFENKQSFRGGEARMSPEGHFQCPLRSNAIYH